MQSAATRGASSAQPAPKSQTHEVVNTKKSDADPIDFQGWPDLHYHISRLTDAGVLPDLEDYR
jgi:hypothetical protein